LPTEEGEGLKLRGRRWQVDSLAMAAVVIWWHWSEGEWAWEQCGDIKTLFGVLEIQIIHICTDIKTLFSVVEIQSRDKRNYPFHTRPT